MNLGLFRHILGKCLNIKPIKNRPVKAKLFHADRQALGS